MRFHHRVEAVCAAVRAERYLCFFSFPLVLDWDMCYKPYIVWIYIDISLICSGCMYKEEHTVFPQHAKRALIDWLIEDQQRKRVWGVIVTEELGWIPLHLVVS